MLFGKGLKKEIISWADINSLPNNKFLDYTIFKAFADNNLLG